MGAKRGVKEVQKSCSEKVTRYRRGTQTGRKRVENRVFEKCKQLTINKINVGKNGIAGLLLATHKHSSN